MSSSNAATAARGPVMFPPGRYGRRRDPARQRRRRWRTYALALVVALAGTAVAVKLYRQYTLAPYQVGAVTVTDVTERSVTLSFDVSTPAGGGASCTVFASTHDGASVGEAVVAVAPTAAQTTAHVRYTLTTTGRPFTGQVRGCGPAR